MEKCVIALDLGTTGNRAIAFNKNSEVIASSYYELPVNFPKPAWVEQDPFDILNTAVKALNDVINKINGYDILSIGITNQRETTILWNKNTGKPVYNAITWQCRRTKQICDNLNQYAGLIKEKTGLFLDPYFSATKIKWIIETQAGVKDSLNKGEIIFGTVDTWVLWNLTGGKVHATESSNASRTLLFNINTLKYDNELLKIFDIPENILPEVKASDAFFGVTDKKIIGVQIPITGILGDQQASLFAHGGGKGGVIKNTYGTGLFVMMQIGKNAPISEKLVSTIAWTLGKETYYALEGSVFIGGAVIKWLKEGLNLINSEQDTDLMAKELKSNEGVYFVPALSGLGAPYWDSDARGLIIGITGGTTANHIARAALESLCYQTKDIILEFFNYKKNIEKTALDEAGINKISYNNDKYLEYKLRVDGKASENDFLMQFQADILNMKVERTTFTEMTALGAAGIAGISSCLWSLDDFLNNQKTEKIYTPSMDGKERDFYYLKWKEAVSRALKWA
jgi:glycerol kinase